MTAELGSTIITDKIDIDDHVGATVCALSMIEPLADREQITEEVRNGFAELSNCGRDGELYFHVPDRYGASISELVNISDNATYYGGKNYPRSHVWHELWTPGTSQEGYSEKDLSDPSLDSAPHARLAVYGDEDEREPLLHFLGMPFNDASAKSGQKTQLEAIRDAATAYELEPSNQNFQMLPLSAKDLVMISLVHRIKGTAMPLSAWGFMRDATLPLRSVRGELGVGSIIFGGEILGLRSSNGQPNPEAGVGLSIGLKQDLSA